MLQDSSFSDLLPQKGTKGRRLEPPNSFHRSFFAFSKANGHLLRVLEL
jgi:hypothetical protein